MVERLTTKTNVKRLEIAENKYGKISGYISHLRELNNLNDMRMTDFEEALRDINFILSEAGIFEMSEVELLDSLV